MLDIARKFLLEFYTSALCYIFHFDFSAVLTAISTRYRRIRDLGLTRLTLYNINKKFRLKKLVLNFGAGFFYD